MSSIFLVASITTALICIFVHLKKMKMVTKKKEPTWELEIYNSAVCVVHFSVVTSIDVIKYACPAMNDLGESVILHIALIIRHIGFFVILSHTLSIAVYKYYIIVIKRPIKDDCKFMEFKYLFSLIMLPILWAIGFYLKTQGNMSKTLMGEQLCTTEELDQKSKVTYRDPIFCHFKDDKSFENQWPILYTWTEFYCIFQFAASLIIASNIVEGIVYYKIFSFAKRYVHELHIAIG